MTKAKKAKKKNKVVRSAPLAVSSCANTATIIREHSKNFGNQDLEELIAELVKDNDKIKKGNLHPVEQMLFNQAKALELIFTNFARAASFAQFNQTIELNLRLALKAQAQCTRTLATLHSMKAPTNVSFVKQANIGGNVQVNNGAENQVHSQKKNSDPTNELLDDCNEKRLVTRKKSKAVKVDTQMEAVDKVHRA